jgi:hypothetical protein
MGPKKAEVDITSELTPVKIYQFEEAQKLLEEAVAKALSGPGSAAYLGDQVLALIANKAEIIAVLTPEWQRREVVKVFHRKKLELRRRRAPEQTMLPGFEHLPRRISIADGRQKPLHEATYRQLREYLAVLHDRHREDPRVAEVKALVELVQAYAAKNPGITVAEVFERESGGK